MIGIEKIQSMMLEYQPSILGGSLAQRAAVALIVDASRSDQDPEIVFIERAHHVADPWSGQMAFPGGRCEPNDMHLAETARRETLEEIGIRYDLTRERVRQIKDKAIRRLKSTAKSKLLKSYLG